MPGGRLQAEMCVPPLLLPPSPVSGRMLGQWPSLVSGAPSPTFTSTLAPGPRAFKSAHGQTSHGDP